MGALKEGDLFLVNRKNTVSNVWESYSVSYETLADNIDTDTIADPVVWKDAPLDPDPAADTNKVTGYDAESNGALTNEVAKIKRFEFHSSVPTTKVTKGEQFQVYNVTENASATYKATENGSTGIVGIVKVEYVSGTVDFAAGNVLEFRTLGGGGLDIGDINVDGGLEIDSSTGQLQVKTYDAYGVTSDPGWSPDGLTQDLIQDLTSSGLRISDNWSAIPPL